MMNQADQEGMLVDIIEQVIQKETTQLLNVLVDVVSDLTSIVGKVSQESLLPVITEDSNLEKKTRSLNALAVVVLSSTSMIQKDGQGVLLAGTMRKPEGVCSMVECGMRCHPERRKSWKSLTIHKDCRELPRVNARHPDAMSRPYGRMMGRRFAMNA
jgi:hypothetical protein